MPCTSREIYILALLQDVGAWSAIVGITVDDSKGGLFKCCKMPSGLLIQPVRANSCKV
jgi:hypothetical protein